MTAVGIFTIHAAGYDASGIYISDQSVSWTETGVCSGNLSPTLGIFTPYLTLTLSDCGVGVKVPDEPVMVIFSTVS